MSRDAVGAPAIIVALVPVALVKSASHLKHSPLKIKAETFPFQIPVGNAPSCDNYMFLLLGMSYEHVFNWADKYKIYHYDICRKPEVVSTQRSKMIQNK